MQDFGGEPDGQERCQLPGKIGGQEIAWFRVQEALLVFYEGQGGSEDFQDVFVDEELPWKTQKMGKILKNIWDVMDEYSTDQNPPQIARNRTKHEIDGYDKNMGVLTPQLVSDGYITARTAKTRRIPNIYSLGFRGPTTKLGNDALYWMHTDEDDKIDELGANMFWENEIACKLEPGAYVLTNDLGIFQARLRMLELAVATYTISKMGDCGHPRLTTFYKNSVEEMGRIHESYFGMADPPSEAIRNIATGGKNLQDQLKAYRKLLNKIKADEKAGYHVHLNRLIRRSWLAGGIIPGK